MLLVANFLYLNAIKDSELYVNLDLHFFFLRFTSLGKAVVSEYDAQYTVSGGKSIISYFDIMLWIW